MCLFLVFQDNDCETRVFSTLDVDRNVSLPDLKALEEVNNSAFVGCPWKTAQFDTTVNVVLIDTVAATNVLALGVEAFEGLVVFRLKIS